MKIVELLIEELDKLTGVDAVALVEEPAIEANFFAFKNQDLEDTILFNVIKAAIQEHFVEKIPGETQEEYISRCIPVVIDEGYGQDQAAAICHADWQGFSKVKKQSFAVVEEKQMVVGPLMIPEKLILRVDEQGEPYYVYFSEDTIQKIAHKVMKDKLIDSLNLEHNPDQPVDGYMVSTWLVEDELKDKQQVYGFEYPKGTWMGQYKIEDKKVWEMVKNGDIKGFSIEGFFNDRFVQANKTNI